MTNSMTLRHTDNTNFWRMVRDQLRACSRDNYGTSPCIPAAAMLEVCQRISNKQTNP